MEIFDFETALQKFEESPKTSDDYLNLLVCAHKYLKVQTWHGIKEALGKIVSERKKVTETVFARVIWVSSDNIGLDCCIDAEKKYFDEQIAPLRVLKHLQPKKGDFVKITSVESTGFVSYVFESAGEKEFDWSVFEPSDIVITIPNDAFDI